MKISHKPLILTDHLAEMRNYMPLEHRRLIERVEAMPAIRDLASKEPSNTILDAIEEFRSIHYGWAQGYINRWTADPRGTGGMPYMQWLDQLIEETRSFKLV
jgi:indoleamine 2,3-dioxygenase